MMRFLLKLGLQRTLGLLPGGVALHDILQHRLLGSVDPTEENIRPKRDVALKYAELLQRLGAWDPEGLHVEIGAGWHWTLPLEFHRRGLRQQTLLDLRRHADAGLVFPAVSLLNRIAAGESAPLPLPGPGESLDAYGNRLGIRYLAPITPPYPLADGCASLVTCTQVLNQPPAATVGTLLAEAARLLRPGGHLIASQHLLDPYAIFDHALPRWHFLRYGEATWQRWCHNPITSANRLRPPDYARLIADLPLETVVWRVRGGEAADLAELARCPPHPQWANYPPEQLAVRSLTFVLRRR